jgi:hypothetical protein
MFSKRACAMRNAWWLLNKISISSSSTKIPALATRPDREGKNHKKISNKLFYIDHTIAHPRERKPVDEFVEQRKT